MNADKQRIAIAEACGWRRRPKFDYTSHLDPVFRDLGERVEMWGQGDGRLIPARHLPDYLNDLNAMHEAEKVLTDLRAYRSKLQRVCARPNQPFVAGLGDIVHATAAQRAEAFLRTIGKWEEDK